MDFLTGKKVPEGDIFSTASKIAGVASEFFREGRAIAPLPPPPCILRYWVASQRGEPTACNLIASKITATVNGKVLPSQS